VGLFLREHGLRLLNSDYTVKRFWLLQGIWTECSWDRVWLWLKWVGQLWQSKLLFRLEICSK